MLFSSISFLYYFLPIVLALYFATPMPKGKTTLRNCVLLVASTVFYAWGEPRYLFLIYLQILSGWLFGLLIERLQGYIESKIALLVSIAVGLGALMCFKYSDFFISNINALTGMNIPLLKLSLPVGISFYTFQIMSYNIDIYNGKTTAERNLATLATYITFFPRLMAGPIVRYADIEPELKSRRYSIEEFAKGAGRLIAGLAKKVLLSNVMAELVTILKTGGENSLLAGWLGAIAYGFQVYFDFSGYSDMAIGMGLMFGFHILENFNYPFISKSITDFWRRWHISLSFWFRDYIYIPLGGNRRHQTLNLLVVWFLTGFWHGAGWNYMAWGMYFGLLLLVEKFLLAKILERLPAFLQHIYALFVVTVSWAIFDSTSLAEISSRLGLMFGVGIDALAGPQSLYYLRSYIVPLCMAALGVTTLPKTLFGRLEEKAPAVLTVAQPVIAALLLLLTTAYIVDGSFNPFIYFKF